MKAFQDGRAPWYLRSLIRKPLREIGVILLHDVERCFLRETAMVPGKYPVHGCEQFIGHGLAPSRRRRLCKFVVRPLLAFDDLKKAVTADADVSNRVRMHRRFAFRHQNPFRALDMRRQSSAGHRGQAQGSIGRSAIDIVDNFVGHHMRIARQPLAAIASVA
jgi:hypothetical protein